MVCEYIYSIYLYGLFMCKRRRCNKPNSTEILFWTEVLPWPSCALKDQFEEDIDVWCLAKYPRGWGLNYHSNQKIHLLEQLSGSRSSQQGGGGILIHATGIVCYFIVPRYNDGTSVWNVFVDLVFCPKGIQTLAFDSMCVHFFRMENNRFKDDAMELLGSLLSAKDCHIQSLRYNIYTVCTDIYFISSLSSVSFISLSLLLSFTLVWQIVQLAVRGSSRWVELFWSTGLSLNWSKCSRVSLCLYNVHIRTLPPSMEMAI